MKIGDRIKQAREATGVSQAALAKRINQAQTTISSWERGRTEPTREDVARVATALDISVSEIESGEGEPRPLTVPLVGYVGAGAEAHFYSDADEGLGEVDAPPGSTPATRAAEIRGESLGRLFDTWLVFYDDVRTPVTPDLIGRLCVVGLTNGQVLVKKLRKATGSHLFHLESNTEGTLFDQEVEWAAKVKTMTPR